MAGRALLHWGAFALAVAVPLGVAATSPLLQWRDPVYIAAGFAGVAGLALMLAQPLLAKGYLPHMRGPRGRRWHRWTGMALIALIIVHVGGLWITSPPDVIDALLLRSLGGGRDGGGICGGAGRGIAAEAAAAPGILAVAAYRAGGGAGRGNRAARRADRGDDGHGVEGGALRVGLGRNRGGRGGAMAGTAPRGRARYRSMTPQAMRSPAPALVP